MGEIVISKKRNSSIELLRIASIFGIIVMHSFGPYLKSTTGGNYFFGLLENSIFNMGCTCFMLISGYFGANCGLEGLTDYIKKIIRFELMMLLYGGVNYLIKGFLIESWSIVELFKTIFPVSTNLRWFMTAYIIIFACSSFIDRIISILSKKDFCYLIIILIVFFYIMPTFVYFEILGDSGKGVVNMLIVYLIGRYISLYSTEEKNKLVLLGMLSIGLEIVLNLAVSLTIKKGELSTPFARDNSIFILIGAICVVLCFKRYKWYSVVINRISKCVFGIFLFEVSVRTSINSLFDTACICSLMTN